MISWICWFDIMHDRSRICCITTLSGAMILTTSITSHHTNLVAAGITMERAIIGTMTALARTSNGTLPDAFSNTRIA